MNMLRVLICAVLVLLVCGCSVFKNKEPEYMTANTSKTLQVPEDLDRPRTDTALNIYADDVPGMSQAEKNQEKPPYIVSMAAADKSNANIQNDAKGLFLLVDDTSDSVQRRLGLSIERLGMTLREKDSEGIIFDYTHRQTKPRKKGFFKRLKFWGNNKGPDYSGTYRAVLRAQDEQTKVFIRDISGGYVPNEAAEHILAMFSERIG